MAKIRYSELPAGLHVSATRHGRRTIIYLKPGLTPAERRAALVRVRSSGRMGHGPELPALSMGMAVGSDRVRTTLRNGAAAMRSHPVLLLPPLVLLVSSALVFVLMSFVTLTLPRHPAAATSSTPVSVQPTQQGGSPGRGSSSGQPAGAPGGPAGNQSSYGGHQGSSPSPSGSGSRPTPPSISSPAPDPSGSSGPSPTPTPSTSGSPTPDPSPSPTPSSSSSSGTCLQIGPLGLCVAL